MARLDALDLTQRCLARRSGATRDAPSAGLLHLRLVLGGLVGDGRLGPPVLVLFEGWDASGKGGAIKRLVGRLDPRHVRVAQFARADARREAASLPVSLLEPAARVGRDGRVRSLVVRPGARRARRRVRDARGVGAGLRRDRAVRAFARASKASVVIKLWLHISGGRATQTVREPARRPAEELEADARRLAQPREARRRTRRPPRRCSSAPTTRSVGGTSSKPRTSGTRG